MYSLKNTNFTFLIPCVQASYYSGSCLCLSVSYHTSLFLVKQSGRKSYIFPQQNAKITIFRTKVFRLAHTHDIRSIFVFFSVIFRIDRSVFLPKTEIKVRIMETCSTDPVHWRTSSFFFSATPLDSKMVIENTNLLNLLT